ncbi:hypothetical protein BU14_0230s0026 [Porphyra umbilicalis]|uniref:Uncharacterized protein n=1 Tax=Porphyra umbilicalis TaxID=2786 RepID=A0A1X6P4M8_PORUM|nr:hypothetical protein BU14_0230s0026 [Porphyra umbilicalis]|eukprot:OSX75603.1 hypothetical protein BU14_0230s0026 [Porphyra umbilicalis]
MVGDARRALRGRTGGGGEAPVAPLRCRPHECTAAGSHVHPPPSAYRCAL